MTMTTTMRTMRRRGSRSTVTCAQPGARSTGGAHEEWSNVGVHNDDGEDGEDGEEEEEQ